MNLKKLVVSNIMALEEIKNTKKINKPRCSNGTYANLKKLIKRKKTIKRKKPKKLIDVSPEGNYGSIIFSDEYRVAAQRAIIDQSPIEYLYYLHCNDINDMNPFCTTRARHALTRRNSKLLQHVIEYQDSKAKGPLKPKSLIEPL